MSERDRSDRLNELIIIENHFYSPTSSSTDSADVSGVTAGLITRSLEINHENNEEKITDQASRTASNIKRKLRNSWNNAKYDNQVSRWILKQRASFDQYQPFWLLGKMYSLENDSRGNSNSLNRHRSNSTISDAYEPFHDDFLSRIWFTYRKDFPKLNGCRLKSDCGWGCMLRCGQMLMAQTLVFHVLGRDWTLVRDRHDSASRMWHRRIVECFLDCPKKPFSMHNLVEAGTAYGKRGGDWYGPASTALILRDALFNNCRLPMDEDVKRMLDDVTVYVAPDGIVYLDELEPFTTTARTSGPVGGSPPVSGAGGLVLTKALLLIIPVRLGADHFNTVYTYHLKTVLSMKSCVGILGGKPKHSMYFVGWQRDSLIYLDPHYCQDAIDLEATAEFPLESFHCKWPRKIPFSDIDPSCAVGFHLRPRTNLSDFFAEVVDVVDLAAAHAVGGGSSSTSSSVKYPLFSVMDTKPKVMEGRRSRNASSVCNDGDREKQRTITVSAVTTNKCRRRRSSSASRKYDYVFL